MWFPPIRAHLAKIAHLGKNSRNSDQADRCLACHGASMTDDSYIKNRPHSVGGVMVDQAMLMPSAELVTKHLRAVPSGQTRTLAELREAMAVEHGAEATCPVTTQRMIKIVAAKSVADHAAGRAAVPFWRVVDPDKPNGRKLPGGRDFILARRKEEKP